MTHGTSLSAGAAEIDITPTVGVALAGHLTRRASKGILDPLCARAVMLESGGTQIAVILLDMICLGNEDAAKARKAAGEAADMPPENVCLCCTHTHTGPSTVELFESPREVEYIETLIPKIAETARLARERLQPARAAWAIGHEPKAGFNRRYHLRDGTVKTNPGYENPNVVKPAGPTDPQIPMLMLESASGEPMAVIANFSLHYIGDHDSGFISADYFGQFASLLQESKGEHFVALLTHGASGDINNIDVRQRPPARQPKEQSRRVAGWVADQVISLWKQAQFVPEALIRCTERTYRQRVRKPVGPEIEAARKQWENQSLPLIERLYGRERLELLNWPDEIPMPVQAFRVGEFAAATMTGEIFCRFGLDLKHASGFPVTALIELANGYGGYIPTQVDYLLGGYETQLARSAYAAPGTGEELVAEAAMALRELRD